MISREDRYAFIGNLIRETREAAGWSQTRLAAALDFETGTAVSLLESGKRKVTIEDLEKIAELFHKDIKHFLGQEDVANLRFALRADKDLSLNDKKQILDFIEFFKQQKRNGRRK